MGDRKNSGNQVLTGAIFAVVAGLIFLYSFYQLFELFVYGDPLPSWNPFLVAPIAAFLWVVGSLFVLNSTSPIDTSSESPGGDQS